MMEYLNDVSTSYGHSYLVQYLVDSGLRDELGLACRKCGQPTFLLDALSDMLQVLSKQGHEGALIENLCLVAKFRYEWYDEDDKLVQLMEEALERFKATDVVTRRRFTVWIVWYTNKLAEVYFNSAVASHKSKHFSSSSPVSHITSQITYAPV